MFIKFTASLMQHKQNKKAAAHTWIATLIVCALTCLNNEYFRFAGQTGAT